MSRKYIYTIGIAMILALHLPMLFSKGFFYTYYLDNLDSLIAYKKILKSSGNLFSLDPERIINEIIGGLKVFSIPELWNFSNIFYILFPVDFAYILNGLTIRLVSFIGTMKFLEYSLNSNDSKMNLCIAVTYALIPFYVSHGITIGGLPLLFYAFSKIKNKGLGIVEVLIIVFYSFYSAFFAIGPFLILILAVYSALKNKIASEFNLGILLLAVFYLLFNLTFLYNYFFDEVSHRTLIENLNLQNDFGIRDVVYSYLDLLFFGYHPSSFFSFYLILLIFFLKIKIHKHWQVLILFLLPLIISLKRFYIPSFEFDLDRVMLFYPIIIISVFYILFDRFPKKKFYIYLTLFLSFIINLNSNVEISQNIIYQFSKNTKPVSLINSIIVNPINKSIKNSNWPFSILSEKGLFGNDKKLNEFSEITVVRFKEFYSEESFNEIKKVIDSDYQALAIGFHPAILHYNGVNSLNTYLVHYPLTYKKNFREIIENELNKNNDAKNSFDSWGNRAYTYVNDLNSSCKNECFRSSSRKEKIKNLDLNLEKFKSMNGRYIISAVQIENYEALNLKLIKFISIDSSIYDFYIYSI